MNRQEIADRITELEKELQKLRAKAQELNEKDRQQALEQRYKDNAICHLVQDKGYTLKEATELINNTPLKVVRELYKGRVNTIVNNDTTGTIRYSDVYCPTWNK